MYCCQRRPQTFPFQLALAVLLCLLSTTVLAQQNTTAPTSQDANTSSKTKSSESPSETKKALKKPEIKPTLQQSWADKTTWRSIGPANMGGRITAITVYEKDPCIWWAATASGGLLKTTNNGVDFEHQFDDQATVSIGDVQVSQSNPGIVWVGTGESNPRNSVSWGDGVYKSVDGGKTWKNMGLKKSFQTGAIAIHPENPEIVWVGALGRLWGPNTERGLFKTTDGGTSWNKVFYIDDKTGVIDVQLNPQNPDEMLIATYERERNGFDDNDPAKRFGAGAGIYKSVDGGMSFKRVSKGLPSCKLGRIGIDYFESDPNFVFAIVESEKIAKQPDTAPFLGIRGEDADVGARLSDITKDSPAAKAGLKKDDIVVSVDGRIVMSYQDMLGEIRKHQAGDKVPLVVSRKREKIDFEIELGKQPETRAKRRRSPFTGTLGGQAANLQGQQGEDDHEYGGVYRSDDGGDSWQRINSLNPRPMYYSNIQVDPLDRNHVYVCGTSLYRSKDGGSKFTGDGGSDGIHVDHHALWIDKRDPRHMILGNDGGIHITYDRMEHWDHLNHVAIGQFYHAGVDSNLDYKVYGGLQDNGSWGGPSRSSSGRGPVNSDWFRVGGGDGFVTLADPEDPDQIYFESQNGGMGRINLADGSRGFIRPRTPRGVKYRFNWKTPFILSPHNSKIHYSAGNYVFRSLNKGNQPKAISPEITNSEKGAASAISESPEEPGLIYVGTTDGAVWITENGGGDWQPLFYMPKKEETKKSKDGDSEEKKGDPSEESSNEQSAKVTADSVSGSWEGQLTSDEIPADRAALAYTLKLDGDKVTGQLQGRRGPLDIADGKFNAQTGEISWIVEGRRGSREFAARIEGNKMVGEVTMGGGRVQIDFEATKSGKDKDPGISFQLLREKRGDLTNLLVSALFWDDPISGEWKGVIEDENLPDGRVEFTIEIGLNDKNEVKGWVRSTQGDSEIIQGSFNAESKRLVFDAENEQFGLELQADVAEDKMSGTISVGDGQLVVDFDATRKKPSADGSEEPVKDSKPTEKVDQPKSKDKEAQADPADPVSGKWVGVIVSPRGEQEATMELKMKADGAISGVFESTRGEREISSGAHDPGNNQLTLVSETDQFSLEFVGTLEGNKYEGDVDINGGAFTLTFSMTRQTKSTSSAEIEPNTSVSETTTYQQPTGENTLSGLMPGPRWVSSIETSHHRKDRCYITFDGHRSNDDAVYVFVTNDRGKTWSSIKNNLPDTAGSVRVIREDLKNENLLFLGCEFSSWYSIDAGETWTQIKGGLPTVAVHEFAIHPTAGEVVAATHGRSLWVADISVLRQLSPATKDQDFVLYQPKKAIKRRSKPSRGSSGTRRFIGQNPPTGTRIAYSLGKNARNVRLRVLDFRGEVVKTFEASNRAGLHVFDWNLQKDQTNAGRFRRSVSDGQYIVELKVDDEKKETVLTIESEIPS